MELTKENVLLSLQRIDAISKVLHEKRTKLVKIQQAVGLVDDGLVTISDKETLEDDLNSTESFITKLELELDIK